MRGESADRPRRLLVFLLLATSTSKLVKKHLMLRFASDFKKSTNYLSFQLWMGTHPDGCATVRGTNERLSSLIAQSDLASYLLNNNDNQANRDEIHLPFIM